MFKFQLLLFCNVVIVTNSSISIHLNIPRNCSISTIKYKSNYDLVVFNNGTLVLTDLCHYFRTNNNESKANIECNSRCTGSCNRMKGECGGDSNKNCLCNGVGTTPNPSQALRTTTPTTTIATTATTFSDKCKSLIDTQSGYKFEIFQNGTISIGGLCNYFGFVMQKTTTEAEVLCKERCTNDCGKATGECGGIQKKSCLCDGVRKTPEPSEVNTTKPTASSGDISTTKPTIKLSKECRNQLGYRSEAFKNIESFQFKTFENGTISLGGVCYYFRIVMHKNTSEADILCNQRCTKDCNYTTGQCGGYLSASCLCSGLRTTPDPSEVNTTTSATLGEEKKKKKKKKKTKKKRQKKKKEETKEKKTSPDQEF